MDRRTDGPMDRRTDGPTGRREAERHAAFRDFEGGGRFAAEARFESGAERSGKRRFERRREALRVAPCAKQANVGLRPPNPLLRATVGRRGFRPFRGGVRGGAWPLSRHLVFRRGDRVVPARDFLRPEMRLDFLRPVGDARVGRDRAGEERDGVDPGEQEKRPPAAPVGAEAAPGGGGRSFSHRDSGMRKAIERGVGRESNRIT